MSFGRKSLTDTVTTTTPQSGGVSSFFNLTSTTPTTTMASDAGKPSDAKVETKLGHGVKLTGNISFTGPAEIDCELEGEVTSTSLLIIGESAKVKGKISGCEVVVRGGMNGDITATKKISAKKPANIVGNLAAPILSIEEGVMFEGRCTMTTAAAAAVKAA